MNLDKILTLVTSQGREKPGKNSEDWLEEPRRECCYKYEREERFFFQCVNYRTLFGGILWILYSQLRIMFLRKNNVFKDIECEERLRILKLICWLILR